MLDFVVFQTENGTEEALSRELKKFSENGINVIHNYLGEIKVKQCPPHIRLKPLMRYYTPNTWTANRFVKWPRLLWIQMWILVRILWQDSARTCVFFSGDVQAWFGQMFKFFGRVKNTVCVIEDWSMPIEALDGFGRFNVLKLRLHDWFVMHFDTTVIITQKEIYDLRNKYWSNRTAWNTRLYDRQMYRLFEPKRQVPPMRDRKVICYFATMRPHNGIEMIFDLLPELNREFGFTLKIVSPPTIWYSHYQELAQKKNLNHLINWVGFLQNHELGDAFEECFCGLNVQELEGNSQQFVVAGRLISFLQYFMVPVVTKHSGVMIHLIRENEMGVQCEPTREALKVALVDAYSNYKRYVENINSYWQNKKGVPDMRIYLDPRKVPADNEKT